MTAPLTAQEAAIIEAVSAAHKASPDMDINVRMERTATGTDGKKEYIGIDARTVHGQLRLDIRDSTDSQDYGPHVLISDVIDAQAGYYSGLKVTGGTPAVSMEFAVEREQEPEMDIKPAESVQDDTDEKPKAKKHRNPEIGWPKE